VTPDLRALVELLPELALGTLAAGEARRVEVALGASPALRRELDRVTAALASVALGLELAAPGDDVRRRLMRTLEGVGRFAPFVEALARLCDLSPEALERTLARVDDAAAWQAGLPGVELQGFAAGPALGPVDAGLLRLSPGATFPRHRHLGHEDTMVLEGGLLDGGALHGPGAVVRHGAGSAHDYAAAPGRPLLIVVLNRGIEPA
jgi:anti-sigma factor ChrR (cupin superfamily)